MKEKNRSDSFSQFMFGQQEGTHKSEDWIVGGNAKKEEVKGNKIEQFVNNLDTLDMDELMDNVTNLMASAEQLKPLFKQAGPFIQSFFKK
ncbi:hypothetical protein [Cytobacillus purgationiresistens]|uniref:Spore coat protein n=1 Tax=Cytobacillus purgationiresistens TaxID=863449 RepID=A0ABU0ABW8_9BACI|nr:hypothetical protein [Cytobacillus purgationiresistens]MDQ0268750.1 hypothetical protein [Cytobacillus purgationiresistens]